MLATKNKKPKLKKILIITAAVIIVICTALMIVTSVLMGKNFARGDYPDAKFTTDYYYEYYKADYPREELNFKSGENTLKGFIYGTENDKGLLVFAHGIGGGHEHYMNTLLWFVDRGWRVFAYDATGSGYSEGSGTMGLPQSALDLDAALTFAESDERLNLLPVYLMGHSWGGYAVTAVLNFDHDIAAVASISGYNKPIDMIMEEAEKIVGGAANIMYPFAWIYNTSLFGSNAEKTAVGGINKSNVPVLIIHGTNDAKIGYDKSSIISEKENITNPNVQYLTLDSKHSSMFYTNAALNYIDEFNAEYKRVYDSYGGEMPDNVRAELYANSNRELLNAPNEELLTLIEEFFELAA